MIDEEATVHGAILRRPLPEGWSLENARRGIVGMQVMAAVISFLSTLLLGLVLLRVYPLFTLRVTSTMRERPGPSLGWGTVALVATPVVAVSFLVTLFALPIGVILLALYLAMVYLARIYAITCLGQLLLRRPPDSPSLTGPFVAGLVLYSILSVIPILGGLVTVLTILFGLGALLIGKIFALAVYVRLATGSAIEVRRFPVFNRSTGVHSKSNTKECMARYNDDVGAHAQMLNR